MFCLVQMRTSVQQFPVKCTERTSCSRSEYVTFVSAICVALCMKGLNSKLPYCHLLEILIV